MSRLDDVDGLRRDPRALGRAEDTVDPGSARLRRLFFEAVEAGALMPPAWIKKHGVGIEQNLGRFPPEELKIHAATVAKRVNDRGRMDFPRRPMPALSEA
jgi:hypothetical protein